MSNVQPPNQDSNTGLADPSLVWLLLQMLTYRQKGSRRERKGEEKSKARGLLSSIGENHPLETTAGSLPAKTGPRSPCDSGSGFLAGSGAWTMNQGLEMTCSR